ncbi:hypothetical protein [Terrisporobacter sp.]
MNNSYNDKLDILVKKIQEADAILIGAGSGMSAAAGFLFYYERDEVFLEYFSEYEKKYGFHNAFDGFYHNYKTSEERWAFNAAFYCLVLDAKTGEPYFDLRDILKDRNYHILTTNQDTQFTRVFSEDKISAIQGDDRYFQCGERCHDELYDAIEPYHKMKDAINENLEIPTELIPRCPKCGAEMEPWVRSYVFLEGKKYKEEYTKVNTFIQENEDKKILFLELGVGRMTPMFIQEPFWNLTYNIPEAFYVNINPNHALLPTKIENKGLAIHDDIAKVFVDVKNKIEL